MNEWKSWKIEKISNGDSNFPKGLAEINNCPKCLYFRGNWDQNIFNKTISIVGSRRMTRYGRNVLSLIIPDLVCNNISVVSGFMYGIDTESHKKCIELGGKTIAVLGNGLDVLMPTENDGLYADILKSGGLVISEYEADFKPTIWSFPQRNRIVAGLSTMGILVVEAGLKSGSLITAKIGQKQKKKIWAIPGPILSPVSSGTNWIIREGIGKMVTSVEDILEKPKITGVQESLFENTLSETERKIFNQLKMQDMTIDELAAILDLPIVEINTTISILAMKNIIEEEAGKVYLVV